MGILNDALRVNAHYAISREMSQQTHLRSVGKPFTYLSEFVAKSNCMDVQINIRHSHLFT